MLLDITLNIIFFLDLSPQTKATSKNKQVGLYQTENICTVKENYQQDKKATY